MTTRGKLTALGLLALAATLAVVLLAGPAGAHFPPQCRFFGPVQFGGMNAPPGTTVTAWLEGPYVGPWSTTVYVDTSGYTSYVLRILEDDPSSPTKDGGVEGETVHYSVDDGVFIYPGPSGVWHGGGVYHPLRFTVVCPLPGDCNHDGEVKMSDISCIESVILELEPPNDCADANRDGRIDVLDVTTTERIIVFGP